MYILIDKKPVKADITEWSKWMAKHALRVVGRTTIDDVVVSTVFLGIDHSLDEGKPMLFETLVFGGPYDEERERTSTWEEAESMHARMVERVSATGKVLRINRDR